MKHYIVLAALALLLVGCTKNEEMETKEALVDETQIEEQIEELSEAAIIVRELEKMKEAKTAEELMEIPSGILTQDFSIERETSMWAMTEVPDDIVIQFLEEMEVLTSEASDPDIIFSSLLYYLGSPQYEYAVGRLLNYHPDFDEPLLPEPYEEAESGEQVAAPSKAIILLDASSSMLLNANGRLKMGTAKSAVRSFASTMGNESAISLYVYGHAGTQNRADKELSCGTIDEVYPLGEYNQSEFNDAVAAVSAKGWTPLAGAIKQVREDHQSTLDDITVYIVSDGAETCDGDPVAEALAFADGNPDRHVNIIGFQVDQQAESQLKAVAEAGNGTYLAADTLDEMTSQITKIWLPSGMDIVSLRYFSADLGGWPFTMKMSRVSDYAEVADDVVGVEKRRLLGAASLLARKEMIDEKVEEELINRIEQHAEQYSAIISDLREEKRQLVTDESDRIQQKIDDYITRMNELKKENRRS